MNLATILIDDDEMWIQEKMIMDCINKNNEKNPPTLLKGGTVK